MAATTLAGCSSGDSIPDPVITKMAECEVYVQQTTQTLADAKASFGGYVGDFKAEGTYSNVQKLEPRFDQIQNDFQLNQRSLCESFKIGALSQDEYARQLSCGRRALNQLRSLQMLIKFVGQADDSRDATWSMESKLLGIADALACDLPPADTVAAAPSYSADHRGFGGTGNANLIPDGKNDPLQELELTAKLRCQRQVNGAYVPVEDCNGAKLRENDRVQVTFSTNRAAYFYMMIWNGTGQFQMLFPHSGDPAAQNGIKANTSYTLPKKGDCDECFWPLDNVAGVLEHIQVITSLGPVAELDALRGADYPAAGGASSGSFSKPALKVRGKMEPIVARGFNTKGTKKAILQPDGTKEAPRPDFNIVTKGIGIAGVEFSINHIK